MAAGLKHSTWCKSNKLSLSVCTSWNSCPPLLTLVPAGIDFYDPSFLHALQQNRSSSSRGACSGLVHDRWHREPLQRPHRRGLLRFSRWGKLHEWFTRQQNCINWIMCCITEKHRYLNHAKTPQIAKKKWKYLFPFLLQQSEFFHVRGLVRLALVFQLLQLCSSSTLLQKKVFICLFNSFDMVECGWFSTHNNNLPSPELPQMDKY